MGNQLCAPLWKKSYRGDEHPWAPKKDSHLLRLWAEIFEVQCDGEEMYWARVSDDVVPVNITCIQDTPETVFQITAYNRHVEKIFDVRLIQPGTRITQASECFVHWRDSRHENEWGLNFTTPVDARRFRDCCMSPSAQKLARKATSAGSLRLSPPKDSEFKRVRGQRRAASNPTSPVSDSRRAYTSPEDIALVQEAIEAGFVIAPGPKGHHQQQHQQQGHHHQHHHQHHQGQNTGPSPHGSIDCLDRDRVVEAVATIPRKKGRQIPDAESLFQSSPVSSNPRQPSISHYDSIPARRTPQRVEPTYKQSDYDDVGPWEPQRPQQQQQHQRQQIVRQKSNDYVDPRVIRRQRSHDNCLERQYSYDSTSTIGNYAEPGALKQQTSRDRESYVDPQTLRKQQQLRHQQKYTSTPGNHYADPHAVRRQASRENAYADPRMVRTLPRQKSESMYGEIRGDTSHYADARSLRAQQRGSSSRQASLEAALRNSDEHTIEDNLENQRRLSKPELRQFSREPTVIHLHNKASANTDLPQQMSQEDFKHYHINDDREQSRHHGSHPHHHQQQQQHRGRVLETSINGDRSPLSPPRKSHSSNSPEWPPPPDPITPISPDVPGQTTVFDSTTLKRMLRSLPDSRSGDQSGTEGPQEPTSTSSSPIRGTEPEYSQHVAPKSQMDLSSLPQAHGRPPLPGGARQPQRFPLESSEIAYSAAAHAHSSGGVNIGVSSRNRDYADSGVSGMTNDNTGSVRSGGSGRSKGSSHKSHTLPHGFGSNRSTGGSSGGSGSGGSGSSSGHQSDLIQQSWHGGGSGSDSNDHRTIPTSDISGASDSDLSSDEGGEGAGGGAGGDDAAGGAGSDSSIHTTPSEAQSSFASKSAAVRKAGWLTVKNWLIHKKRKIDLAPKRTWKKYWMCLKGTMLLLYQCEDGEPVSDDSVPRHILIIEGGIAQAVPEHPKREHIFSLSTAFGDAYLFQATSQVELENWVSALHSACASSFARQHGKENTLKLLKSEISKLENSIDIDIKMKKMADLQLTVVTDPRSKQAIAKQIAQWDENLEKLYIEQYRLRCYMSSLQGTELPNPKTLLTYVSKNTKMSLSRVGVFTVTSFHALVCARTPLTTANMYNRNKKRGILSTFKAEGGAKIRPRSPNPKTSGGSGASSNTDQGLGVGGQGSGGQGYRSSDVSDSSYVDLKPADSDREQVNVDSLGDNLVRIILPNGQTLAQGISDKMTVQEVLESVCSKRPLNINNHFIRFKLSAGADNFRVPDKSAFMENQEFEAIEICPKILFQMELVRTDKDNDFGFSVEAELAEDTEEEDELCAFISEVTKGGLAHRKGLVVGDEILVINGKVVSDLDMMYIETMQTEATSLCMTIRACRTERPVNTTPLMEHADVYIDHMVCPPPPTVNRISDKAIDELIIPAPSWVNDQSVSQGGGGAGGGVGESGGEGSPSPKHPQKDVSELSAEQIDHLLMGAEQVTHFCRLFNARTNDEEMTWGEGQQPAKPLSDAQKLRKVILELIDTERHYVKDLNCLIERYLEPLKEETFLSGEDTEQLFGNIQEIVQFQKMFLHSLEEAIELEPEFTVLSEPKLFRDEDLRRILFSLAGSFLYYANHFKLYSSFCASHSKAQKVLNPETNVALRDFLRARNPKQQHSATLESYLIKPIQRILKYPLLLQQLKQLTSPNTDEHHHLAEALRGMEAVAGHINEMQKIYEEYGNIFDDLIKHYRDSHPKGKMLDLNVGELQMYGTVTWLNAIEELGKMKKGTELFSTLFVFKSGIVLLVQERIKGKKRAKPAQGKQQTSTENIDIARFQGVIPVDELQVRSSTAGDTDKHGMWEIVHCKSETEGRPERLFQFASSFSARNEFIRTIRNTIRESVRRMAVPANKSGGGAMSKLGSGTTTTGRPTSATKRPDNLPAGGQPWSLGKKKGKQLKSEMARHSMDMEDRFPSHGGGGAGGSGGGSDIPPEFRIRSRTFSDLNNMDDVDPYMSGSQSTLASDRGAAKLLHSSNNPTNYSSTTTIHKESLGSPIWKPRVQSKKASPHTPHAHPHHPPHPQSQSSYQYSSYQQQHQQHIDQYQSNHGGGGGGSGPHTSPHPHTHPHSPYSHTSSQRDLYHSHSHPAGADMYHSQRDMSIHSHSHQQSQQQQQQQQQRDERSAFEAAVFGGSAYSDYSSVVMNERQSTVLLTPPNSLYPSSNDDRDTEC